MAGDFYGTVGERSTIEFQFQYNKEQLQALRNMILAIKEDANIKIDAKGMKELDQWLKRMDQGASSFANITTESKIFNNNIKDSAKSTASLIKQLNAIDTANERIADGVDLINQGLTRSLQNIKTTKSILDKFGDTLFNSAKWTLATTAVKAIQGSFSKAAQHVTQLDKSLNNIRIVTKQTQEQMEEFTRNANKLAQQLGTATNKFAQASLIYYQQGLHDTEVEKRTQTTIKAANVTKQSVQEVSENLTALWNGFQITQDKIEESVDKIAAVAAHSASNLAELTSAMSKVSSVANTLGVDLDQLTAQIATIISTTRQAPETVGTALRTIYARMADLVQDGTDEFGVSLGKVSSQLESVGVSILDTDGQLRDMGVVIDDIAKKWNSWSSAQKQAIAIAVAGKRQYNNLFALFENWDQYSANLEQSKNSLGELQKQQDIFLESYEAKFQKISSAWEEVIENFKDDTAFKGILDVVNGLVKGLGILSKAAGGGMFGMMSVGSILLDRFQQPIRDNLTQVRYSQLTRDTNRYNAAVYRDKDVQRSNRTFSSDEVGQLEGLEIIENFEKNITYKLAQALQSALNVFSQDEIIALQKRNEELKQKFIQEARMQARGYDKETDLGFDIIDSLDYDKLPNVSEDQMLDILTRFLTQKANILSSGELYDGDTITEYFDKALGLDKNGETITDYLLGNKDDVTSSLEALNESTKEIKELIRQNKKLSDKTDKDNDINNVPGHWRGGTQDNKGNLSITPIDKGVLKPGDPDRYLVQARVADGEVLQVIPKKDVKNPVDAGVRVGAGWDNYAQLPGYRNGANIYIEGEIPHSAGIYAYKQVRGKGKGQEYIGQAVDLYRRFKSHLRRQFNAEDSIDFALQNPENTFVYKIIKNLDNISNKNLKNELNKFENIGINLRDSYNSGYNKTSGNTYDKTNSRAKFNQNFYGIDNWSTKGLKPFEAFKTGGTLDNKGRRTDSFRQINFDMDGTIADLYGRMAELYPGWDTRSNEFWKMIVSNNDAEGYRTAKPLVDMQRFKDLLYQLQEEGWRWGITSWLAGGKDHPEYDNAVRAAKKEWLKSYGLEPDEVHIVKYGTPKAGVTARHKGTQILFDDEPQNRTLEGAKEVALKKGLDEHALDKMPFASETNDRFAFDVDNIIGTLENLLKISKGNNDILRANNPIIDNRSNEVKSKIRWKKKYPLTHPKFPTVRFQDDESIMLFSRAYDGIESSLMAGEISQEQKDLIDMLLSETNVYFGDYGEHKGNMAYKNENGSLFFGKDKENETSTLVHELLHVAQERYGKHRVLKKTKNITRSLSNWKMGDDKVDNFISQFNKGRKQNVAKAIYIKNYIENFARNRIKDEWLRNRFAMAAESIINDMTRGIYSNSNDPELNHLGITSHDKNYYRWGKNTKNRSIAGMESNSEYGALSYLKSDYKNLLKELFKNLGFEDLINNIEHDFVGIFENPSIQKELHKFRQVRGYKNGGTIVNGPGYKNGMSLTEIPDGILQPGDPDRYLLQARVADGEALQVIPKNRLRGLPGYNDGVNLDSETLRQIRDQLFTQGIKLNAETIALLQSKLASNKQTEEMLKEQEKLNKGLKDRAEKNQEDKKNRNLSNNRIKKDYETATDNIKDTAIGMKESVDKMQAFFDIINKTASFNAGRFATGSIGASIGTAIEGNGSVLGSVFAVGAALKNLGQYFNPNDIKTIADDWKKSAEYETVEETRLKDGIIEKINKNNRRYYLDTNNKNRQIKAQDAFETVTTERSLGLGKQFSNFTKTASFGTAMSMAGLAVGLVQSGVSIYKSYMEAEFKRQAQALENQTKIYDRNKNITQEVNRLEEAYKKGQLSAVEFRSSLVNATKELHDSSISAYAFAGNIKQLNKALNELQTTQSVTLMNQATVATAAGYNTYMPWEKLFKNWNIGIQKGLRNTTAGGRAAALDILSRYGLSESDALNVQTLAYDSNKLANFKLAFDEMTKNSAIAMDSDIYAKMSSMQSQYNNVFSEQAFKSSTEGLSGAITSIIMNQNELYKTSNTLKDFNDVLNKVIKQLDEQNINTSINVITDALYKSMEKNLDDYTKLSIQQEQSLIENIQKQYIGSGKEINNSDILDKVIKANFNIEDKYIINKYQKYLDLTSDNLTSVFTEFSNNFKNLIALERQNGILDQLQAAPFAKNINTSDKDKANFIRTLAANYGTAQEGLERLSYGNMSMDTFMNMQGADLMMKMLEYRGSHIGEYEGLRNNAISEVDNYHNSIKSDLGNREYLKNEVYRTQEMANMQNRTNQMMLGDFGRTVGVSIGALGLSGGILPAIGGLGVGSIKVIGDNILGHGDQDKLTDIKNNDLTERRKQLKNRYDQVEGTDANELSQAAALIGGGAVAGLGTSIALGATLGSVVPVIGTAIGAGVGALGAVVVGSIIEAEQKKIRGRQEAAQALFDGKFDAATIKTLTDAAKTDEDKKEIEELARLNKEYELSEIGLESAKQSAVERNKQLIKDYENMATQALANIKNYTSAITSLNNIFNDFNSHGNQMSIQNWASFMEMLQKGDAGLLNSINRREDGTFELNNDQVNAYYRQQRTAAAIGIIHGINATDYRHNQKVGQEASVMQRVVDLLQMQNTPIDVSQGYGKLREIILGLEGQDGLKGAELQSLIEQLGFSADQEELERKSLVADILGISADSELVEPLDGILLYSQLIYKTLTAIAGKKAPELTPEQNEDLEALDNTINNKQYGGRSYHVRLTTDPEDKDTEQMSLHQWWENVKNLDTNSEEFKEAINKYTVISDKGNISLAEYLKQNAGLDLENQNDDLNNLVEKNVIEAQLYRLGMFDLVGGTSKAYFEQEKDAKTKQSIAYAKQIDYYANVNKWLSDINTQIGILNETMQHTSGASYVPNYAKQIELYTQQAAAQQTTMDIAQSEQDAYRELLAQYDIDISDRVGAQHQIAALGRTMDSEKWQELQQWYQKYVQAEEKENQAAQAKITAEFAAATAKFEYAVAKQVAAIEYLDITKSLTTWNLQQHTQGFYRQAYRADYGGEGMYLTNLSRQEQLQMAENLQAVYNTRNELAKNGKFNPLTGQYNLTSVEDFQTGSDALKKMQGFVQAAQQNAQAIYQNLQQAYQNLNTYLSDTASQLDIIQSKFNLSNNALQTVKSLMDATQKAGLNYFIKADTYYKSTETVSKRQIQALYDEVDLWDELKNTLEEGSKEQQTAQQNYINSIQEARAAVVQLANTYKEDLVNGIDEAMARLEDFIALGNKLDFYSLMNGFDNTQSNKYFDEIERLGKIQSLRYKVDSDLETEKYSKEARKKILEFYEQEEEFLKNREEMTEQDVKYTNLKYELLKKQIALEEAQNAKNSMKLVRNAQGNWSYQYVADAQETDQLKDEINDVHQQIQDLTTQSYENAVSNYIKIQQEMQSKLSSLAKAWNNDLTNPQYIEQRDAIIAEYTDQMRQAGDEYGYWRQQVAANTADWAKDIYAMNSEAYALMTTELQRIVDATRDGLAATYNDTAILVEENFSQITDYTEQVLDRSLATWSGYANGVIEQWTADNGTSVKAQIQIAIDIISEKMTEFNEHVRELEDISDLSFNSDRGIINSMHNATQATSDLNRETKNLTDDAKENVSDLVDQVDRLENAWENAVPAVQQAEAAMTQLAYAVYTQQEQVNQSLGRTIDLLVETIKKADEAGKVINSLSYESGEDSESKGRVIGTKVLGSYTDQTTANNALHRQSNQGISNLRVQYLESGQKYMLVQDIYEDKPKTKNDEKDKKSVETRLGNSYTSPGFKSSSIDLSYVYKTVDNVAKKTEDTITQTSNNIVQQNIQIQQYTTEQIKQAQLQSLQYISQANLTNLQTITEHQIQAATDFYLKESEMSAEEKQKTAEILSQELSAIAQATAQEREQLTKDFEEKYGPAAQGILDAFREAAKTQIEAANASAAAIAGVASSAKKMITLQGEQVEVEEVNTFAGKGNKVSTGAIYSENWEEGGPGRWIIAPRSNTGGPGMARFNTGGYTGDWPGNEGKLAIVDKKEQIFKPQDTSLIHAAAQLLTSDNSLKQALLTYKDSSSKTQIQQAKEAMGGGDVYHVTANFPNANDAEEIRQALLSLPNIMSQYITTSGRDTE